MTVTDTKNNCCLINKTELPAFDLLLLMEYIEDRKKLEKILLRGIPKPVIKVRRYWDGDTYALCPACNRPLDREYINFCSYCGQILCWEDFVEEKIEVVEVPRINF